MGTLHRFDHSGKRSGPAAAAARDALPAAFRRQVRTGRELAEAKAHRAEEEYFPTAAKGCDRLLGGGLERGALTEVVGGRSSGRLTLVLSVLAAATGRGDAAAFVDLGDSLVPASAVAAGCELERLLWVRPRTTKEALVSAEALLGTGIPLVVVDLGLPPVPGGRGAEAAWLRLARAARAQRVAFLVASPYRVSGTAAETVLEARSLRCHWHGRGAAPRLLAGLDTELTLVKGRRRPHGDWGHREAVGWRRADAVLQPPEPHTGDRQRDGRRSDDRQRDEARFAATA